MATLHQVTSNAQIDRIVACIADGADVNAYSVLGRTALMIAGGEGFGKIVRILLDAGAETDLTHQKNGSTALHVAASGGHLAVVRMLCEASAVPDIIDNFSRTPAIAAATFNRREVVEYLFERGARRLHRDRNGRTAEDWLALGGVQSDAAATMELMRRKASSRVSTDIRSFIAECANPDEFAARRGRNTLIWSYGHYDYDDPTLKDWATRVWQIINDPGLLEVCEEKHLTGQELAAARKDRARRYRIAERDRLRTERKDAAR